MAKEKITKRLLTNQELGQRKYIYDTELLGFGAHVGAKAISFFIQYRHGYGRKSKVRRNNIGRFGALTVEQARGKAKQLLAQVVQGDDVAKMRQKEMPVPTFSALWDAYVQARPSLKGIVTDTNRFKKHIKPRFGDMLPTELEPSDVDRLRFAMLKTHRPGTVKNTLELLRRLVNFGVRQRLFPPLPFIIELPRVDNVTTEDLTSEELKSLMRAIEEDGNSPAANMMKMVLYTGMRRGELFRLQWDHIDFARGSIRLVSPKGGVECRIPLNTATSELLHTYPQLGDSPYVFPGRSGGLRVDITKQVNKIKDAAGLPTSFRALHGLRHVYASMLASSGEVDMYTLQKLLTHKSPSMTQRYAHLRDDVMKKASEIAGGIVESMG